LNEYIFQCEEWIELDKGTLTQEVFIELLSNRHPEYSEKIKLCMTSWLDILTPKKDSIEILNTIDFKKYNVLLLSNFHEKAYKHITDKYDFFHMFHGGIISYKENLVKPHEEIYKCLIKRYNLKPEESVFIDDTEANVAAAEKLGFKIIHFKSADILKKSLMQLNIELA
jgi:haloacid dehalogenase superfamily, subfamily IA, variant 3 with third motif having DD or ED